MKSNKYKAPAGLRLTVRRQRRERGLAGVVQGELGHDIVLNGAVIGSVRLGRSGSAAGRGWYWSAGGRQTPITLHNTAATGRVWLPTEAGKLEALNDCLRYVVEELWKDEKQ